jgi:hypothetical protein
MSTLSDTTFVSYPSFSLQMTEITHVREVRSLIQRMNTSQKKRFERIDWSQAHSAIRLLERESIVLKCGICYESKPVTCCLNPIPHTICKDCARRTAFCPECREFPLFHTPSHITHEQNVGGQQVYVIAFDTGHLIVAEAELLTTTFWMELIHHYHTYMLYSERKKRFFQRHGCPIVAATPCAEHASSSPPPGLSQ